MCFLMPLSCYDLSKPLLVYLSSRVPQLKLTFDSYTSPYAVAARPSTQSGAHKVLTSFHYSFDVRNHSTWKMYAFVIAYIEDRKHLLLA